MKKILIVDDDEMILDVLTRALAAEDRTFRRADDGKSALNWISKEVFDLVICDLMMPQAHGFQVIEWIKSNPDQQKTKIIMLTAKAFKKDEEKAHQAGADLFISKPFELADLQQKVAKILTE
jgi:CheY-like chemotaxis protein